MATRSYTSASGLNLYAILTRNSDGKVWQTTTDTAVTFVAANIANYDIALAAGETSQDRYTLTIPSALPAGMWTATIYEYATPSTPVTTDDIIVPADSFGWDGAAITSGSPGTNLLTIGNLRTLLQVSARNAGINSTFNSEPYSQTEADLAIRDSVNMFIRRTRASRQTDSVTQSDGENTVDLSGIAGFALDRIFQMWAKPVDTASTLRTYPIRVVDYVEILEFRQCNSSSTSTLAPHRIGFPSLATLIGETDYDASEDLTAFVNWNPPLVSFTIGDTSSDTANIVANLPGDLLEETIRTLGVVYLQRNQPQQLKEGVIANLKADFERHVLLNMGANSLGSRSIRRRSISEIRAERWRW